MTTIVSRADWGARPPRSTTRLRRFDGWFIHWLGTAYPERMTDVQVLQSVQRFHMDARKWRDVAYSFAIGREHPSRVYELRGAGAAGGHTEGHNSTSMAIVFLLGEGETPTAQMLYTCRRFIADFDTPGAEPKWIRPHNAVKATACPGPELTAWAKTVTTTTGETPAMDNPYEAEVNEALTLLAEHAGYGGTADGWFGPQALDALHRLKNDWEERGSDLASHAADLDYMRAALDTARADLDELRRRPASELVDALAEHVRHMATLLEDRP